MLGGDGSTRMKVWSVVSMTYEVPAGAHCAARAEQLRDEHRYLARINRRDAATTD